MHNVLSIDLEPWSYFLDDVFNNFKRKEDILAEKALNDKNLPFAINQMLELLEKHNQKATFFTVGRLYEWYPDEIDRIAQAGHEIGYHTHNHIIVKNCDILERELEQSKLFIKKFAPLGFRAPYMYITRDSLNLLKNSGFRYSSSTYDEFNIMDIEGMEEIPVACLPFRKKINHKYDLPKSLSLSLFANKLPFGGGMFLPLLGPQLSNCINKVNRNNVPAVLFFHQWQIYTPEQMSGLKFKLRVLFKFPTVFPYTINALKNLEKLLNNHTFVSFKEYFYADEQ